MFRHWRVNSRLVALGIAGLYVVTAIARGAPRQEAAFICLMLMLPVGMIWFPEEFGAYTGFFQGGYISQESPPLIVTIAGWAALLVGYPAMFLYLGWI